MNWLTVLAGETRTRLLNLVRGGRRSIRELADALGITDNAVRTHVAALERDGLVRQGGTQRDTGGKPARLYELTPQAEELFPKAYALVLIELVDTLRDGLGTEPTRDLLRQVGKRLGAAAAAARGDGAARASADGSHTGADDGAAGAAAAAAVLESIGGAVRVEEADGGWMIRSAGCPLSGVVTDAADVCALAESLVGEASGLSVTECCDRSDRPRCAFRLTQTS